MVFRAVIENNPATRIHIADDGEGSPLDASLDALAHSSGDMHVSVGGQTFDLAPAMFEDLAATSDVDRRIDMLASALPGVDNPRGAAVRLLNVIGRMDPASIREAGGDINVRLRGGNGAARAGDVDRAGG